VGRDRLPIMSAVRPRYGAGRRTRAPRRPLAAVDGLLAAVDGLLGAGAEVRRGRAETERGSAVFY
jgi:hypothetical protein